MKDNITITHPELCQEWDFELNGSIKPENYTHGSRTRIYWRCKFNELHIWKTAIHNRTGGKGCPFCYKEKKYQKIKIKYICENCQNEFEVGAEKRRQPGHRIFCSKKCSFEFRTELDILKGGNKRCSKCYEIYPATNEYFYASGENRLHSFCKECLVENGKERLEKLDKKRKEDPKEKIWVSIKNRTRGRPDNRDNAESVLSNPSKIIGCDKYFFAEWIEKQFEPEMNWENYGAYWELDHIIPIICFNLPEESEKCFNYKNVRPLPKKSNQGSTTSRLVQIINKLRDGILFENILEYLKNET